MSLDNFKKDEVVPDVIDNVPQNVLKVKYAGNLSVDLGNELTPTQVKDDPIEVQWPVENPDSFFTLAMVDPDATSRQNPIYREIMHWMVVNIPMTNVSAGETLFAYRGSGPPKDTGLHRYIFLVYKQPNRITFEEQPVGKTSRKNRLNFKIRDFAKKYNLGQPIAGNYYQAQYDDYVPIAHAQVTD